ncbi:hypothetical protein AAGG74_16385 [Bacillus mexicanus]|uniref:hypothetical protein n=1 Tax=Bacillus mexicanus TaxID=2834415 RepID=UPI003D19F99A
MSINVITGATATGKSSYLKNKIDFFLGIGENKEVIVLESFFEYVEWLQEYENQIVDIDLSRKPNIFELRFDEEVSQKRRQKEYEEHLNDLKTYIEYVCFGGNHLNKSEADANRSDIIMEILKTMYENQGDSRELLTYIDFFKVAEEILVNQKKNETLFEKMKVKRNKFKNENLLEELFIYGTKKEFPQLNKKATIININPNARNKYDDAIFFMSKYLKNEVEKKLADNKDLMIIFDEAQWMDDLVRDVFIKGVMDKVEIFISCHQWDFKESYKNIKHNVYRMLRPVV